MGLISVDVW